MRPLYLIFLIPIIVFAAKKVEPKKGIYELLKDYNIDQCAEFNNPGACMQDANTPIKKGHYIYSDRSFYNDDTGVQDWDVGILVNGQNRSILKRDVKFIAELNCQDFKKVYRDALSTLDQSCKIDSDCMGANLNYNSCNGIYALAKTPSNQYRIEGLKQQLEQVRKICKWVHPPCPAIFLAPVCNPTTKRCEAKEKLR